MDMKTGEIYEGDPRPGSEKVELDADRTVVTVLTGPFKGRRYEVVNGKRGRRVEPDVALDAVETVAP